MAGDSNRAGVEAAMPWFVYVVRCGDGSLYTGIAVDVEARVSVHNDGRGARYTRSRRPVKLVYVERRRSRSSALKRELAIKALERLEKLALVAAQSPARKRSAKVTAKKPR
jgi:predicted GIY-YIG superfamily endonuclease